MKKLIIAVLLSLFLGSNLWANWALISLDELVADSKLIVVGTLHSGFENDEGIGRGYILIEQVFTKETRTLEGVPLKSGDNLKITWADNWACASGMHRRRENERGLWLLKVQNDGTVTAGYPGRFRSVEDLVEVKKLLRRAKDRTNAHVDVTVERPLQSTTNLVEHADQVPTVDVASFYETSPARAIIAFLLSLGLYWVLYRSRFRIR
jgi:hypothetical protein